jgi:hypothetical protein
LDGQAIREIAPDMFALIPKSSQKRCIVRESPVKRRWITDIQGAMSLLTLGRYMQLWIRAQDVELLPVPNRLLWQWPMDTRYFFKSCYDFLFKGPSYRHLGGLTSAPGLPTCQVPHPGSLLDRRESRAKEASAPTMPTTL